jgi:hypothetical protein
VVCGEGIWSEFDRLCGSKFLGQEHLGGGTVWFRDKEKRLPLTGAVNAEESATTQSGALGAMKRIVSGCLIRPGLKMPFNRVYEVETRDQPPGSGREHDFSKSLNCFRCLLGHIGVHWMPLKREKRRNRLEWIYHSR